MGTCPACLGETPPGARFCPACGMRQIGERAAAASERRLVTALFCDLVGFTAMCEQADPEDVDALLRSYHRLVRSVVEQYGGVVEKFIGDGVVGAFGTTIAHEDDAERAVRAAVRLRARVAELAGPGDVPVEVRIGINTGEALVRLDVDPSSGEGFLAGDAVNTASRLQSIAPPGGIVIGDLTHTLAANVATCEMQDPVTLRGKVRPTRTWLVIGLVASPGVDLERSFGTPHVGREVESGILQGLFRKVVASATPQFATVVAEAGLGKSRLVHELAGWLDRQPDVLAWWRQVQCPAFGDGLSVWPMAQIVRQHAGITDADELEAVAVKLRGVLEHAPDPEWLAERLGPLVGLLSGPASKEENFSAWLLFLESVARAKPTVLVVEDLHWASPLMLEFIRHITRTMTDVPFLGIFTTRPDLSFAGVDWDGTDATRCGSPGARTTRVDLHPLSPAETERLLAALGEERDDDIREEVARRCGGNPLYAEVLMRLKLEDARPRDPATSVQKGGGGLPPGLQSLIAARLDSLTTEQKALLADAAVVGEEFDTSALSLFREAGVPPDDILSSLVERDMVRPLPSLDAWRGRSYAFQHAVTREVAYAQLPRPARMLRHETYGLWLLGRPHEEDELLGAHHLRTALDLADKSGDVAAAARLREPTLLALTNAAAGTMSLDLKETEHLAREALSLATTGDPARAQLLVLLGRSLQRTGQLKEAETTLTRAAEAFDSGDAAGRASALIHLADTLLDQGEPRVVDVAEEALSLLGEAPSPELVAALELRGALHLTQDQPGQARARATAALQVAEQLDLPEPLRAVELVVLASCLLGEVEAGMREAERLGALLASPGTPGRLPGIYGGLAELTLVYKGAGHARELAVAGQRLADERHDLTGWATCRVAEMEDRFFLGDWRGLPAALDDLARRLEETGNLFSLADVQDFRLLLSLSTGTRPDDGLASSVGMLENGLHGNAALGYLTHALEHAALGCAGTALDMLDLMDRHTVNFASIPSLMLWWSLGMRLSLELGAAELTARLADRLLTSPAAPAPAVATAAATLAELRGEPAAASLYESSAAAWESHGVPFEHGHARLGQARCLAARGRIREATGHATEASTVFRRLGAGPSLVSAERWLADIGADDPAGRSAGHAVRPPMSRRRPKAEPD